MGASAPLGGEGLGNSATKKVVQERRCLKEELLEPVNGSAYEENEEEAEGRREAKGKWPR